MKKLFFFMGLTQLISCSQPPLPALPAISPGGASAIDNYLKQQTNSGRIPGVAAIIVNNKEVIYKNVFGMNSMKTGDSLKADDIFAIASMTKAVTAVAIMQLFDEGKINLNDTVTKFLPEAGKLRVIDKFNEKDTSFSTVSLQRQITIRDLLTHTSGLCYPFCNKTIAMIDQSGSIDKNADAFLNYPLIHQPGSKWTYGFSYDMLGVLIEKISGKPLDKYFDEHIFQPLGMTNTWFNVPEQKHGRLINYYSRINDTLTEQPTFGKQKATPNGGGGLYSTAEDYAKLLQMFLNEGSFNGHEIIKHDTFHEMTKNQIGDLFVEVQPSALPGWTNDFPSRPGKDKFGFGFVITTDIDNDGTRRNPGSFHWAGLFNTYHWVDPQAGIGVIILMQVLPFYDKSCIGILDGFEALIYKDLRRVANL